jgi:hypothetical protein
MRIEEEDGRDRPWATAVSFKAELRPLLKTDAEREFPVGKLSKRTLRTLQNLHTWFKSGRRDRQFGSVGSNSTNSERRRDTGVAKVFLGNLHRHPQVVQE